jgi:hypothetical protein
MKFAHVILALVLALGFASIATNAARWDGNPVHSGNFSLKLEDNAPDGTPQAFVAFLWNLQDGDEITVGFWRYDDTPDAAPSVRLWGHWNDELPGNTGLVIEARTYSVAGDIVWLDDLHIEMPDHVYAQIPGCSPVGTESESWGGVKALFR